VEAFEVRRGRPEDARGLAELLAAIAEERDGIATEPPVDVDARTEQFAAAIEKARSDGLHKLSLEVFPHNEAAIALYRKFGFLEEGRRVKHYRRANGELWDSIVMGLLL
jgi:L-amino acid N-acyltransferase YncA